MKRKNYAIYFDGQHIATKHAWNSALKYTGQLAANHLAETVEKVGFNSIAKNDRDDHIDGEVTWQGSEQSVYRITRLN